MDKDLTWTERELALTAIDLAMMVDEAGDVPSFEVFRQFAFDR